MALPEVVLLNVTYGHQASKAQLYYADLLPPVVLQRMRDLVDEHDYDEVVYGDIPKGEGYEEAYARRERLVEEASIQGLQSILERSYLCE
jgi:hypothetical protein